MDNIFVFNEDCRRVMFSSIEQNSIDMVITSPPYDNLRSYNGYNFNTSILYGVISGLMYVLKDGGVVVWVVGDQTIKGSETGSSFKHALLFKDAGFFLHDTMIYKKKNPMPKPKVRYNNCFEYMFVFSKGKPKTFNPIMEKSKYGGNKMTGSRVRTVDGKDVWVPVNPGVCNDFKIVNNIFEYAVGSQAHNKIQKHPAVFPIQLATDQIKSWSNENDVVFDPFMGSGTVAIACKKLNRVFIGCEINEEYFNKAVDAIEIFGNKEDENANV